jgi:nucleoid DNA-binding protein
MFRLEKGDRIHMAKKKTAAGKFNFIGQIHEKVLQTAEVTKKGDLRVKKSELKKAIEATFLEAAKRAASGERVRFPVLGALVRKEVVARKAGKGTNPFTGEPMDIKARPATKKPRWSFPRSLKETFGNKKNW